MANVPVPDYETLQVSSFSYRKSCRCYKL